MNLLRPFFWLADAALEIYLWLIIIWVIMSWLIAFQVINTNNRFIYQVNYFLYRITEPALAPIRRFMPNLGGIDISPMVLLLLIYFARLMLHEIARSIGVYGSTVRVSAVEIGQAVTALL